MNIHQFAELKLQLTEFCKYLTDNSPVPVDMQDLEPEIKKFMDQKLNEVLDKGL